MLTDKFFIVLSRSLVLTEIQFEDIFESETKGCAGSIK